MSVPLAERLAAWAAEVRTSDLSAAQQARVSDSLLDTVGVTIAAMNLPEMEQVRALAEGSGEVDEWGSGQRYGAATAALLNATAGHLLDFDDTHYLIHGHPSTVVLPAALAAAQEVGGSGDAVLRGYIAGIGVMAAIARAFGPDHYTRGWHSTSTCGVFGAAAAAAVSRGLDCSQIEAALSIAASSSLGIRANFGTVLKPMHAGFAARAGIEAARLAAAGIRGSRTAIDGSLGSIALFGDEGPESLTPERITLLLSDAHSAADDLGLKLYPCCRGSHFAIDAALDARAQLTADTVIDAVTVTVPLGTRTALLYDDPQDGLQGKFSLPYTVATALLRGLPLVEHFTDAAVRDASVRSLMARITVAEDTSAGDLSGTMTGRYAVVSVTDTAGETWSARVDDARGSATRPLTAREVDEKFDGCVRGVLGADAAARVRDRIRHLADVDDVRALFRP